MSAAGLMIELVNPNSRENANRFLNMITEVMDEVVAQGLSSFDHSIEEVIDGREELIPIHYTFANRETALRAVQAAKHQIIRSVVALNILQPGEGAGLIGEVEGYGAVMDVVVSPDQKSLLVTYGESE